MDLLNSDSNLNEIIENINKEYFEVLQKELNDAILTTVNNLRNVDELMNAVKLGYQGEEGQEWLDNFNNLANETATSLENSYKKIEADITTLFNEWEKFQIENKVEQ